MGRNRVPVVGGMYLKKQSVFIEERLVRDMSCTEKVKARIRRLEEGTFQVEVKRAKFKHWHILGSHYETDLDFRRALGDNTVEWECKIIEPTLFKNL